MSFRLGLGDWGICLLTSGVYAPIELIARQAYRLNNITTKQIWQSKQCELAVSVDLEVLDSESSALIEATLTSHLSVR